MDAKSRGKILKVIKGRKYAKGTTNFQRILVKGADEQYRIQFQRGRGSHFPANLITQELTGFWIQSNSNGKSRKLDRTRIARHFSGVLETGSPTEAQH